MEEYGVWVYYPWSRRLVHLLDKEEFVAMRTNRNQYKITKEEQALLELKNWCHRTLGRSVDSLNTSYGKGLRRITSGRF